MKKLVLWLAAACVVLSCAGVSFSETFRGTSPSMKGALTVEVDLDGKTITAVRVVECVDTDVIKDSAIASVPARIVSQQNIDVDAVTGATVTSFAIKGAVRDALAKAGLDPKDYSRGSDGVKVKAEAPAEDYDVVIVGGGIAGMSAAIQAKRDGVNKVLVLEKNGYTGGSSLVCGGGIWIINTEANAKTGVNATVDDLIGFLKTRSENKPVNEALLKNVYSVTGSTGDYITQNGLPYSLDTWSLGYPENKLPVLWSVNNSKYAWETGESKYFESVEAIAEKLGADIRVNSKVTSIVHDGNTVSGVKVEDQAHTYTVNAKKVILATGGFTRNRKMVEQYAPDYVKAFAMTGAGSTGDGITMTRDFGTPVVGEGMMGLMGVNMNYGYYGPIGNLVWHPKVIVNKEGKTFGMDKAFYSETLALLLGQTESQGIGIFDGSTDMTERLDMAVKANSAKKFESLKELADSYKIDYASLEATAKESNLSGTPYYAMIIRPLFIGSIPGLKVDEECRVLNSDGKPVVNLLAAGELIFGNMFQVRYPASGTGMGLSTYTGALAARTAFNDMGR